MTCLPLIGRELRVRARNRAFFRLRLWVGVAGALICLPQLFVPWAPSPASMGQSVFNSLAMAGFVVCCSACLWTADVISSEKREGTLGLLFLTRVKELDLLLGKFGSAGLTGLCSLAAFLPMLMIPVLAGGVTGGEAFRKALVLLNTLFLSLAAGMCESAASRTRSGAVWRTVLVLGALMLVPYVAAKMPGFSQSGLGYVSPLYGLEAAGDVAYKTSQRTYWIGLGFTHMMAWMLAAGAAYHLRRSVRHTTDGEEMVSLERTSHGAASHPHRMPLEDGLNPVEWLLRRQRGVRVFFWTAAAVSVANRLSWLVMERRPLSRVFPGFVSFPAQLPTLAVSCLSCALFAWGASRFVIQARSSGELELLLTTGLGRQSVISGQWRGLKRMLAVPASSIMLMSWVNLIFPAGWRNTLSVAQLGPSGFFYSSAWVWAAEHFLPALVGSVQTLLGVACVCWLAMDSGLRSPNQSRIIVRCLCLGTLLPFVINLAVLGYLRAALFSGWLPLSLARPAGAAFLSIRLWPWLGAQLAVMAYFLRVIWLARRRLALTVRQKDAASFTLGGSVG